MKNRLPTAREIDTGGIEAQVAAMRFMLRQGCHAFHLAPQVQLCDIDFNIEDLIKLLLQSGVSRREIAFLIGEALP